jgi:hypothetical protein
MKIYRGRIEPCTREIVENLVKESFIEVATPEEVEEVRKDLESVLNEYMRMEREITEKAKDAVSKQGMDYSSISKIRRSMAKEKEFGLDDEGLDYIVQQMIEIMLSSVHVAEVFGQDHDMNRVIVPILRKHMAVDEELEREVRQKIKHLQDSEGGVNWEIEYNRVKADLERLKKLK